MARQPDYACAVIEDGRGWLLLQLRPAEARYAAGQLTCFGGKREPGEDDLACLRRELVEELGWAPPALEPCCELCKGEHSIARFFRGIAVGPPRCLEADQLAISAPLSALPALPVSPWHALVLAAILQGRTRVDLAVAHPDPAAERRPR
jgi:8-oxo-dGTP pyrophosphatase MutT (NUDIX family)